MQKNEIHTQPEVARGTFVLVCLIAVLAAAAFGTFSVGRGQTASWDYRNYHFYNPYAFLNGRLESDVAPAFRQSYLNPLLDIPACLAIRHLPPKIAGFLLGAAQGLNLALVVMIALLVLRRAGPRIAWPLSLAAGVVGMTGPTMWLEVGTTFNDNLVSLPLLAGMYLFLRGIAKEGRYASLTVAGLLTGLGAGMKLTAAIYLPALAAAAIAVEGGWTRRSRVLLATGSGCVAGFLLAAGFWMWKLWTVFGNPLFPFMNHIFRSPLTHPVSFCDTRFLPVGPLQTLFFPFVFADGGREVAEAHLHSWWFALLYTLCVAVTFRVVFARFRAPRSTVPTTDSLADPRLGRPLILFLVVGYIAWQILFSYYRYLMLLEALAPLFVLVLVDRLIPRRTFSVAAASVLLAIMLAATPRQSPHMVEWTSDWFDARIPVLDAPDKTLVLLVDGRKPLGFLVPLFPPSVRFIRVDGEEMWEPGDKTGMQRKIARTLREHEGAIYTLGPEAMLRGGAHRLLRRLRPYNLEPVPESALPVETKYSKDVLCLCRRAGSGTEAAGQDTGPVSPAPR